MVSSALIQGLKWTTAIAGAMAVAACSTSAARVSPFDSAQRGAVFTPQTKRVILSGVEGRHASSKSPIQHVVFIVQENRSFNNLFLGYPGATTQNYGYDEKGDKIALRAQTLKTHWDLPHSSYSFFIDCDGQSGLPGTNCKMDGWDNTHASIMAPPNAPYSYVPRREIKPYWAMANQYVLADQMFASNLDASYVSHQYAVAAYASRTVDGPSSYWGCEGGSGDEVQTLTDARTLSGEYVKTCMKNPTIGINADHAGLSWRFYAGDIYGDGGLWSSYQSDDKVYNGPDWKSDVISPPAQVLTDIGAGKLANITWITPTFETSDHAGMWDNLGPAWVASVVDAVGKSKFWKSTAIFIMWDDWGGWFDPVQPVYEDYDGLGFRVPLIMISPYARQTSVTHVQYETASVLRFIEDNFGLPQMAASDARANDPANDPESFDYSQSPRKFEKIRGAKSTEYWLQLESATRRRPVPAGIIGDD